MRKTNYLIEPVGVETEKGYDIIALRIVDKGGDLDCEKEVFASNLPKNKYRTAMQYIDCAAIGFVDYMAHIREIGWKVHHKHGTEPMIYKTVKEWEEEMQDDIRMQREQVKTGDREPEDVQTMDDIETNAELVYLDSYLQQLIDKGTIDK